VIVATTSRLALRRWEAGDMALIAPLYADPETMRFFGDGSTFSAADLQAGFAALAADYATYGYGNYAVIERATAQLVGHCGVRYKPDRRRHEADVLIGRAWWRRGYGFEATQAVFARAFRHDRIPAIFGIAHRDNRASIVLMTKLGMVHRETIVAHGMPSVVYQVTREEFGAG
jgi:RimJ/RimL family protein N-acetyltransferase